MKKLCILQVTPTTPNPEHIKLFANKDECDFYFVTHDSPHPDALKFCPNTTWAETRNILVDMVHKDYEYYGFVDYDYGIEALGDKSILDQLIEDLTVLVPATLTVYPWKNISSKYSGDHDFLRSCNYSSHLFTHNGFKMVHNSLLDWFFPYTLEFDGGWSSCHFFNILEIPFYNDAVVTHNILYNNDISSSESNHNQVSDPMGNMDRMWQWIRPAIKFEAIEKHLNMAYSPFPLNTLKTDNRSLRIKEFMLSVLDRMKIVPIERNGQKTNHLNYDLITEFFDLSKL